MIRLLSILLPPVSAVVTVVCGIYMAQPWGDNEAYQSVSDYVVMALFLAWAVAPYVYLIYSELARGAGESITLADFVGLLLICLFGCFAMIDSTFVNIDPQGGLLLVTLPVAQWMVIGLCKAIAARPKEGKRSD